MEFTDYDRAKWQALDYIDDRCNVHYVWTAIHESGLTEDPREMEDLAGRIVRDLFDQGLIFATYAPNNDAYNLAFREFAPVPRERFEQAWESDEPFGPLNDETLDGLWIFPTLDGQRTYWSLPAEAFVTPGTRPLGRTPAFPQEVARIEAEWGAG